VLPDDVALHAESNWWGSDGVLNVADSGSGASIITSPVLSSGPTIRYADVDITLEGT
jgi:hypothetical protein